MKDVLNFNKVDIVYLINVGSYSDGLFLNGYTKYEDGRNVLFVINEIKEDFTIDKNNMLIISEDLKTVFTFLTPNSENFSQIKKIIEYLNKDYIIYGDFN